MKELTFVRHAKSDWGDENLRDIDRPLNNRGYSDAYYTANWYAMNKKKPDVMISSTATRALNTALIFARILDYDMANFHLNKNLYETNVSKLLNILKTQENSKNHLMIFLHNPAITNFCNELSEDLYFENVATCGIVSFEIKIKSWDELEYKTGKLNYHQFPKDFKNRD